MNVVSITEEEAADLVEEIRKRHARMLRVPGGVTSQEIALELNVSRSAADEWLKRDEANGLLWSDIFFDQEKRRNVRVWYGMNMPRPDKGTKIESE